MDPNLGDVLVSMYTATGRFYRLPSRLGSRKESSPSPAQACIELKDPKGRHLLRRTAACSVDNEGG